jgi:hypothetical protein
MGLIMAAPLSREHTFLILEAGRLLDARQSDNFYDYVAGALQDNHDITDADVERAISVANQAMRKQGAN